MAETDATSHPAGAAFLLAQVGAHAARRFAERLAALELAPPHAGALRLLAREPGMSQRTLGERLGAAPSRIVALVDDLENRGLITRERSSHDRRVHELRLTADGKSLLDELANVASAHDQEVTAPLTADERRQLRRLLTKLADASGLTPGVHPGYQRVMG